MPKRSAQEQAPDSGLAGYLHERGLSRLAPRVHASWLRSEHYGVSVDRIDPAFSGDIDTGSLLYECAHEVLSGLHRTLADEPVSLMVADRDGLVLARLCSDRAIRQSLDQVQLAPGFSYSERNAGTNGLGLSLADRAPTLVRADEHYCTALQGYTCAAVPVLHPTTGELAGTINLTTWSDASSELLLALAQAAAGNTSALMAVRSRGRRERPAPHGEVFRVQPVGSRSDGDAAGDPCVSGLWQAAMDDAHQAMAAGRVVAVVGEPGSGRRALAQLARRRLGLRERLLTVRPPTAGEVPAWLALWTPELRADTCVTLAAAQTLPAWAAGELAPHLAESVRETQGQGLPARFVLTASDFGHLPAGIAEVVDTVVEAPPLRLRPEDVMPLARAFAARERRREVAFTAAAAGALSGFDWPENVRQLRSVVREAAARTDLVDARHLSPDVFSPGSHRLSRLETVERNEIVRCLTEPGATVVGAAARLGISRATLYRKIAQYDLTVPRGMK